MIWGWLLLLIGIIFAVFGWVGTATLKIKGLGGFTLSLSGVAGLILIFLGVVFLGI